VKLSTRLTVIAATGAAVMLALLVLAFNLVLDARLRSDVDNVLRERAATVLRGLGTVDGRLSVLEAPDQGAVDAQTWIFAEGHALERPAGSDARNQRAAEVLAQARAGFATVGATDIRLHALEARRSQRRLGVVVVAASLAPYETTASAALAGSIAFAAIVLIAIVALSRWLIGRALRPVARMTARAAAWGEHDLSQRFFVGEPRDEIGSLAAVFDALLGRLGQGLLRERRLTAEVSHELRTPLSKIVAEADLATSRDRPAEDYRVSLALIRDHALELQRILETLLAAARASTPGGHSACDAQSTAQQASSVIAQSIEAQGKCFELVCARRVRVAVEASLLERVLAPLLENAARHAEHRVTLEIAPSDGSVVFSVKDDGGGVVSSDRQRIFEAGVRGASAPDGEHRGAGLGLALARRLARSAGGDVEARESDSGADFVVHLPGG